MRTIERYRSAVDRAKTQFGSRRANGEDATFWELRIRQTTFQLAVAMRHARAFSRVAAVPRKRPLGRSMRPGHGRRRRFYQALERAGLPRIRYHDLRHCFATLAVQRLELPKVQQYLGHAHISTTMRYVHHTPAVEDAARLTDLFGAGVSRDVSRNGVISRERSEPQVT